VYRALKRFKNFSLVDAIQTLRSKPVKDKFLNEH